MRYWAWLVGKVAAVAGIAFGLLQILHFFWSPQMWFFGNLRTARFGFDLFYTLAAGVWFLLVCGMLYVCFWDQKYRCRVCLRRLRMPVETGSWGRMLLLGRPRIEYICPYGHGTLKEEELQIAGIENPEWTGSGDPWDELCAASKDSGQRR